MGLRSDYEYSYHISMDDKIISPHTEALTMSGLGTHRKVFIFEIRTKFTLRRKLDEDNDDVYYDCEMMETESLSLTLRVSRDQHGDFLGRCYQHFKYINYRLNEYSMPGDQIQSLIHEALDFAEQIVSVVPSIDVVPIAVDVHVCTVQLDGETMDDAFDRAVEPDCLTPLDLLRPGRLGDFLVFGLPRIRVGEGFDLMEACAICMGGPTAGALVSLLACGHAYHSLCIVRWLTEREACPLCRHQIVPRN